MLIPLSNPFQTAPKVYTCRSAKGLMLLCISLETIGKHWLASSHQIQCLITPNHSLPTNQCRSLQIHLATPNEADWLSLVNQNGSEQRSLRSVPGHVIMHRNIIISVCCCQSLLSTQEAHSTKSDSVRCDLLGPFYITADLSVSSF